MLRLGLLLVGVALLPASLRAQDVGYRVVVHRSNGVNRLTRDQVSKIFLRQLRFWENRQHVLPVDQPAESPARRSFTKRIHQRTIASVQTWWQQQIFAGGEVPPPERASDAEILEYVRKYPSAIGYIRAGVPVGADLKIVAVTP